MEKATSKTRTFRNEFFLEILLLLPVISFAQMPDWNWAKSAGGESYDRGTAIKYTSGDELLVAGYFQDIATFDTVILTASLSANVFIAKYSSNGAVIWAKAVAGSSSFPEIEGIYEDDAGNIYLIGTFGFYSSTGGGGDITFDDATTFISFGNQDIFIAKYDSSGNFNWARHIGSAESDKAVTTMDNSGHLILSGKLWNTVYFNSTTDTLIPFHMFDIFVSGYDTAGTLLFYRNAASCTEVIEPMDVTVDAMDNIYLGGMYNGKPTFGLPVDSIDLPSELFYQQGFIARYDPLTGDNKWAFTAGDTMNFDNPFTINYNGDDKLVMSGKYLIQATFGNLPDTINLTAPPEAGYGENYLVQYDTSGHAEWAINAGHASAGGLNFRDAIYQDGHLFIAGDYSAGPAFFGQGPDGVTVTPLHAFFVADYDDFGILEWVNYGGGLYYEVAESVTTDLLNNLYITGYFLSGCSFPGTPIELTSAGFEDILVARLDDISVFIDENSLNQDQSIFPNPASSEVTLNFEGEKSRTVQLFDLLGELLFQINASTRQIKLNIENLPEGIYIVTVTDDLGNRVTHKMLKK